MKKYILFPAILIASLSLSKMANAQAEDVNEHLLQYVNEDKGVKFTVGGRLFADVAYYHSDFTPLKSGAALTDARIRTSMTYNKLYFYADFDFSKGTFKQKNLFLRYNFAESLKGTHSVKVGYYNEPSSMAMNTSAYNYHFLSRPASVTALAPGRALGATYKFYNTNFFADQGVFAENKYNDQIAGFQGVSLSGRWLYKLVNTDDVTLQFGASFRFAHLSTGEVVNNVLQKSLSIEAPMQTAVDATTRFLNADVMWANNVININPELLVRLPKAFLRGEYIYKKIYKSRPDERLFENQLGGFSSWATLSSWQSGNPIRASQFSGAYVEMGYMLFGSNYGYDNEYGLLKGSNGKNSLEVVARYNYTNLNDINDGDFFLVGKQKFYPNGVVSDYPVTSTSIGGGKLHAATLGLNYTFNQYIKLMGEYQFSQLDNVYYPEDSNFHQLQMRLMFSF